MQIIIGNYPECAASAGLLIITDQALNRMVIFNSIEKFVNHFFQTKRNCM
jgi:hypothetical protein